jgi:hypothetical protein
MIDSITNGSVIIDGYANINSNTNDPSSTFNSISSNVQQITTINGYKVASYSLAANGFTPTTPPSTTTTSSNYLLYVIIGSAIVGIAAIVIIVCLCLRGRKKKEVEDRDQMATTEKVETEQIEPATSKNMFKS